MPNPYFIIFIIELDKLIFIINILPLHHSILLSFIYAIQILFELVQLYLTTFNAKAKGYSNRNL